jgi:hypothetical protein
VISDFVELGGCDRASVGQLMRNALVITPFATVPLDAGRRRRVHQTARLLADQGFRLTLVLLACEDGWRIRHQDGDFDQMREQWGEVIVVYGDPKIGRSSRDGDRHRLDEWWDFNLEHTLRNMLSRRSFEVCLVHQAWLSRAFDLIDGDTAKVLDIHGISRRRSEAMVEAAGSALESFLPDEASELFAIERADIVLTALEADAAYLARRIDKKIINLPFYAPALEENAAPAGASSYADRDKVTFGFLADRDMVGADDMRALLAALQPAVGGTPAPLEIVFAGSTDGRATMPIPIREVACIESVARFCREVDFAIIPQFSEPGLNTALADALALGMPVLASRQAAAGFRLDASAVCASADEMASRMVEISLSRPPLLHIQAAARDARDTLRSRCAAGATKLRDAFARATGPIIIDLSGADPQTDCLVLLSYLSILRILAGYRSVLLVLPPHLMVDVARFLPRGVTPIPPERLQATLEGVSSRAIWVDVFGIGRPGAGELSRACRIVRDLRWSAMPPTGNTEEEALAQLPFFHSNLDREPAALQLRRRRARLTADYLGDMPGPIRFVFVDNLADATDLPTAGLRTRLVPLSDAAKFRSAAMALIEHGSAAVEVVWLTCGRAHEHRLIVHICALRDIPLWAMLDGACFNGGKLPQLIGKELDRACERQLRLLGERTAPSPFPTGSSVQTST